MGIFRFDAAGQIVAFEEKPNADTPRARSAAAFRRARRLPRTATNSRSWRRWASTCSRARVMLELLEREPGHDFGRELIPRRALARTASSRTSIAATGPTSERSSRFTRPTSCWAGRRRRSASGTRRTRSTRTCAICPGSRLTDCIVRNSIVVDGCFLDRCHIDETVVGLRTPHPRQARRITRSVLLGADFYDDGDPPPGLPKLGIGRDVVARPRHRRQERAYRRRRPPRQRTRRHGRRRRRLLHPRRDYRRAERRRHRARHGGVNNSGPRAQAAQGRLSDRILKPETALSPEP